MRIQVFILTVFILKINIFEFYNLRMLVKDPKKRINSENLYSDLVNLASDKENFN